LVHFLLVLLCQKSHLFHLSQPLAFYQNVSKEKALRDASNDAEKLVRDFGVEASMRLDVFTAKLNAQKNIKASGQWDQLTPEQKRLVDKLVRMPISFVHLRR
jgi:metallopeptidase MepB